MLIAGLIDEWIQGAVVAEQLGFHGYTAAEHHFEYNDWCPFPLQYLSAAAAVTSKIRLATSAMLYTLYDPLFAMEAAATADILSGGRISLGLGMGYRPDEFDGMGFAKKTRGSRLSEAMEIMRLGTGNKRFSYDGKHYHFENNQVCPEPIQKPIDMWFCGGTTTKTAERAGRSGFNYWIATSPYESAREIVGVYKETARNAGYREDKLRIMCFRDIFVGDTVTEAEQLRDYCLHNFLDEHIRGYGYLIDDEGKSLYWPDYDHPSYVSYVDSMYCGTVEMVIEEIKRYEALGIEALTISPLQMELFSKQILPEVS